MEEKLLITIAHSHCNPVMTGPDGLGFMFCAQDFPEAPSGYGATEYEAAVNFLQEIYDI